MKTKSKFILLMIVLAISIIPVKSSFAGVNADITVPETDSHDNGSLITVFYVYDLRDRETFIQLTVLEDLNPFAFAPVDLATAHVQIFDVSNNCNENDFFDDYTLNDTHVYNMRDIQTNDGNPSGVLLPDGSYGIVAVTLGPKPVSSSLFRPIRPVGNLRILDNNGYEYQTNAQTSLLTRDIEEESNSELFYTFNFNQQGGVSLSDVMGITLYYNRIPAPFFQEWTALPVQEIFSPFDIDIYDLNEVPFSCRDVLFSCVDEDNPLLEELLSNGGASVASFEYGINNAIPHSKGGELLCPGNNITDGFVVLRPEDIPDGDVFNIGPYFFGYVGLNNGNGRGSFESFWVPNCTGFGDCSAN